MYGENSAYEKLESGGSVLYDVHIKMGNDSVESYFAMRKIEMKNDKNGIPRIFLNNKPYFQKGVLDQGYWPDGLYTPPCDEAMIYDIQKMKDLGFNMIRKHIKIEPQRWYYHCDRIGMLVWQDMVNGGREYKSWYVTWLATVMEGTHIRAKDTRLHLMGRQDPTGQKQFESEMKETIRRLYNHPSVVTWVIFNEGWGQFKTRKMTDIALAEDHTRLIDSASGWFDQGCGDIKSIHDYFFPLNITPEKRVTALTEFGGYSLQIPKHSMYEKDIYGYKIFKRKKISLSDLLAYPILMLDKNSTTNEFLHRLFQQHQLDLVPEIELTSNDLLIDLARIGLGIAFIPDYCISKESDGIFTLDMNEEMPERSLVIAYNEQLPLSKATQEFLSCFHPVEE